MSYFKKNILFVFLMAFTIGFFGAHDLSAMKRGRIEPEGIEEKSGHEVKRRKVEVENPSKLKNEQKEEVFVGKKGKKFFMLYNDLESFKTEAIDLYNEALSEQYDQEEWLDAFASMIKSFENRDGRDFYHAFKSEDGVLAAIVFGSFESNGSVAHVELLGTTDQYRENGLASRLLKSISEKHTGVQRIELDSLSSAKSFYKKRGFVKNSDGLYELNISKASEELRK
ncbi:MAG: GNAT family N-acetyltransferase [bacterium]